MNNINITTAELLPELSFSRHIFVRNLYREIKNMRPSVCQSINQSVNHCLPGIDVCCNVDSYSSTVGEHFGRGSS